MVARGRQQEHTGAGLPGAPRTVGSAAIDPWRRAAGTRASHRRRQVPQPPQGRCHAHLLPRSPHTPPLLPRPRPPSDLTHSRITALFIGRHARLRLPVYLSSFRVEHTTHFAITELTDFLEIHNHGSINTQILICYNIKNTKIYFSIK